VPAAAVIPAPIVYIKVAVVKTLVVGFLMIIVKRIILLLYDSFYFIIFISTIIRYTLVYFINGKY